MRLIDADALKRKSQKVATEAWKLRIKATVEVILNQFIDYIDAAPTIKPEQRWIPCSEKLPEEDNWLGGSGRQFSDEVLVSVVNYDNEDIWIYISQTIDGEWALELPSHFKIIAWMPLPEPYKEGQDDSI